MPVPINIKDFAQGLAAEASTGEPLVLPEEGTPNPVRAEWDAASTFEVILSCKTPSGDGYLPYLVSKAQYDGLKDQFEKARREKKRALEALQKK